MNVADYLLANANDTDIALITPQTQHTYRELREAAGRLIHHLRAVGVRPGDGVGILGENSFFWVAAYLASLKMGALAVPLPVAGTPDDLKRKLGVVSLHAICLDGRSHRRFTAAVADTLPLIFDRVLVEDGSIVWEPAGPFDDEQDAALMLTSGTTAEPRVVRITHRNIRANTESIVEYLALNQSDRILVILPFYYCFGTSLLHTHLRAGGSLVLCNTFAYPETALDMIEQYQCTGLAGVPTTYQTLLRNSSFASRGLKNLCKVQQAGGKLQPVFLQELVNALPQGSVYVMYGQTEATARLSYLPPELLATKLGSVGRGIPGVELRVLDEEGLPVKPGQVGEIWARGENISPGYLNEPAATEEKIVDGHLRTGDLATVDEDGYIFIVDRKSDFIKASGHRVSSQEIESHLLKLPEVVAAAVVGIQDPDEGEFIKAFIVLRQGAQLREENVLNYCLQHMARYMVPKQVVFLDALPTNAHGKVVKSSLRYQRATA